VSSLLPNCAGSTTCSDRISGVTWSKIDVEGHELNVLNGMRRIVANSSEIKISLREAIDQLGTEQALEEYFDEGGFDLYQVGADSSLDEIEAGGLKETQWLYARHATRRDRGEHARKIAFFGVSRQLLMPSPRPAGSQNFPQASRVGEILFHGPYWFLRKGVWRFKLHGTISGAISFRPARALRLSTFWAFR